MLFASGNPTKDKADAAAIEKAAEKLEEEEAAKAQDLVKQANAEASKAKEEAQKAAELDAKAKTEAANNAAAAKADSDEALAAAKMAVNASAEAQNLSSDALKIEKDAQVESSQMFMIANKLKKDADGEQKQSVAAVDGAKLTSLLEKKEDVLIVFYAPWCPHCQTYVMADESGDPEKAPIELLNKELQKSGGPQVVKFNVDADKAPSAFAVSSIPTVFLATKAGAKVMFEGDPHDFQAVKDFIAKPEKPQSSGNSITVLQQQRPAATVGKLRKHA